MSNPKENREKPPVQKENSVESKSGGMIGKYYAAVGERIGWYNQTAEPNKIADAEILSATGYDTELVNLHHRVRDLLEANARWNGVMFKGFGEPKDIYIRLRDHLPVMVELLDENGEPNGTQADLCDFAQLLKIDEHNKFLGKYRFKQADLFKKFFAGESLVMSVKGENVDLRKICPKDDMRNFDFDQYLDKVAGNEVGFQWLGGFRDKQLDTHHIENASHTLFIPTGRTKINGNKESLWMPVSARITSADARCDVPKKDISFRAAGHVHEVGDYCEENGTTVKFHIDLLRQHRKDISLRDHNRTNTRMYNAAVGLSAKEEVEVISNKEMEYPPGSGEKRKMNVVCIGNNRKGGIYKGLKSTYDKKMVEVRGFGLTPDEADDLIFRDIIAPFICNNAQDWLMCFAKAVKSGTGYTPEKAVVVGGENWAEFGKKEGRTGFCVGIPCEDADDASGMKYFYNYNELIEYVNKRIGQSDIEDISTKTQLPRYSGMSEKQRDKELEDQTEDEVEEGEEIELGLDTLRATMDLLKQILGTDFDEVIRQFSEKGVKIDLVIGGKKQNLLDFIKEKIRQNSYAEILVITGESGDKGNKKLLTLLTKMSSATRTDLREYSLNGKTPEARPVSVLSPEMKKIIKGTQCRFADFGLAVSLCENFLSSQPGFTEEVGKIVGEKKEKIIKKDGPWAVLMNRVAGILLAIKKDEGIARAVGNNQKNPQWLIREALIIHHDFKLLKELGL